jgi:hypothetical protein
VVLMSLGTVDAIHAILRMPREPDVTVNVANVGFADALAVACNLCISVLLALTAIWTTVSTSPQARVGANEAALSSTRRRAIIGAALVAAAWAVITFFGSPPGLTACDTLLFPFLPAPRIQSAANQRDGFPWLWRVYTLLLCGTVPFSAFSVRRRGSWFYAAVMFFIWAAAGAQATGRAAPTSTRSHTAHTVLGSAALVLPLLITPKSRGFPEAATAAVALAVFVVGTVVRAHADPWTRDLLFLRMDAARWAAAAWLMRLQTWRQADFLGLFRRAFGRVRGRLTRG